MLESLKIRVARLIYSLPIGRNRTVLINDNSGFISFEKFETWLIKLELFDNLLGPEWSPMVGLLSLILSALGFPITIWQLVRTRRAADAAKAASESARMRMNQVSALRVCEEARTHARNITKSISEENWPDVLLQYRYLSTSITDLLHGNTVLDEGVAKVLTSGIEVIDSNLNALDRAILSSRHSPSRGKEYTALHKLDVVITKALANIERIST